MKVPVSPKLQGYPNPPRYRSKRVKDARSEAQKEIEDYRKQKEDEFHKFEKEHTSGNKKAEEDASQDAEEQVKAIRSAGDKQGQQVVDDLLRVVTDVRPEVPDRVAQPHV
ncbi:MAG: hypothetical protein L6R42_006332 [Xanthoria sp. 1 TBL-2021]|nr:MAG: hypothetical protein L6R42_006332 [Xanthoria sp. 1 TBL-2021]